MLGSGSGRVDGQAMHGTSATRKGEYALGGISILKISGFLVGTPYRLVGGKPFTPELASWVAARTRLISVASAAD